MEPAGTHLNNTAYNPHKMHMFLRLAYQLSIPLPHKGVPQCEISDSDRKVWLAVNDFIETTLSTS